MTTPARRGTSFAAAARMRLLPVMLVPVLTGTAYAWERTGAFAWGWFAVTLAAAAAGHLAYNLLVELVDAASGADAAARADGASIATGSGVITRGEMSRDAVTARVVGLLAIAAVGGVLLALARDARPLAFGAAAFVLAAGAIAPPLRYGSRVPGLGEVGAFVAGILQFAGAYVAQAEDLDRLALRAALVPALLHALVVFQQQFLRHRTDRAIGRPNTVSVLGPPRALWVTGAGLVAVFGLLFWHASAEVWPASAAAGIVAALPVANVYLRARRDPVPVQQFLTLLGAVLGATLVLGAVLVLSVAIFDRV